MLGAMGSGLYFTFHILAHWHTEHLHYMTFLPLVLPRGSCCCLDSLQWGLFMLEMYEDVSPQSATLSLLFPRRSAIFLFSVVVFGVQQCFCHGLGKVI
mmetsp:Transcript_47594/g.79798  ORF Transcript_47594/g.79798 Transcript_47594/m.79798 type:complete len:98 (-) Transcript_47594:707-1000(-)